MQWEGDPWEIPPLLGVHRRGEAVRLLDAGPEQARMRGYAGSVAFSGDGRLVAITSPRGGRMHVYRVGDGSFLEGVAQADVCGLAAHASGFVATDGTGGCRIVTPGGGTRAETRAAVAWDNHLVRLNG
jgi:uncharacterized protein